MKRDLMMDAHDPRHLRGDPMPGERYYSRDFMQREWDQMWRKVWHIAGRRNQLKEPGDYIVHDFLWESVIIVMQDDGSLKAFFNSCPHRGQRLVWSDSSTDKFTCPYHGWQFRKDGECSHAPFAEDFPQGNPCGRANLRETRVGTWGGFIWYAMSDLAPSLEHYLAPFPDLFKNYPMDDMVRVFWMQIDLETNWKFAPENFGESYHVWTAHPQALAFVEQHYLNSQLEMYPSGHGCTTQPMRPSITASSPDANVPGGPFDDLLRAWEIDPAQYPDHKTKVMQGWRDLKAAKRKLGPARGFAHYPQLNDTEITDSIHTTMFPNVTLTFNPDALFLQRTEPHRDDPNKCTFDLWCMVPKVEGKTHTDTPMVGRDVLPICEAEFMKRSFDRGRGVPELEGGIVMQDLALAEGQQWGLHSQGYTDAYLAGQETRVRYFHEVLNDYLEGRR